MGILPVYELRLLVRMMRDDVPAQDVEDVVQARPADILPLARFIPSQLSPLGRSLVWSSRSSSVKARMPFILKPEGESLVLSFFLLPPPLRSPPHSSHCPAL